MAHNQQFGNRGEELAVAHLIEEGYEILARNWRFKHMEVDIIARDGDQLVIVEVKSRSGNTWGEPFVSVNHKKQRYLILAAERFIYSRRLDMDVRFDIISIIIDTNRTVLEHIKEAFHPIAS
jgi:putative endonuclease